MEHLKKIVLSPYKTEILNLLGLFDMLNYKENLPNKNTKPSLCYVYINVLNSDIS